MTLVIYSRLLIARLASIVDSRSGDVLEKNFDHRLSNIIWGVSTENWHHTLSCAEGPPMLEARRLAHCDRSLYPNKRREYFFQEPRVMTCTTIRTTHRLNEYLVQNTIFKNDHCKCKKSSIAFIFFLLLAYTIQESRGYTLKSHKCNDWMNFAHMWLE